ncbi:MAG: hypothetical protein DRJ01_03715 [Bacteroidetes bacterium]|nr:MAG: hypothetical protein DRJ01_03715 [Bacteroidota bacterium]
MKKVFTILAAVLITASVFAQTPEKMTYQAVVRDDNSTLITSTQVGIEINIYQGSASGTLVYTETQTPTTNVNGLLSIEIGGQTGFDLIDWANGPYFIETNIDMTGGTNYTITGVSQLLTVPYALHAKTAETITGGITETDPVFTGSEANNITSADITNLSNLSGTNTGDQDISGVAINTQAIQDTANQIRADIPDVSGFISTETDPVFTTWNKDYADLTNKPKIADTVSAVIDTTTQFVRKSSHWIKNGNNLHYSNGLVGIGVAIPTASLDIYDNVGNPFLKFVSEDNVYTQWISDRANVDDYLIGIDGGNNRFTFANITTGNYPLVLQNDNVGIGILNPTEKLHVVGNIQMEGQIKNVTDPTDAQDAATKAYVDNKASTKYQVGDFAQGGIVFWVDETGEHGLVCAKSNQDGGSGVRWYAGTNGVTRATGDGPFSGELNTLIIISSQVSIGDNGEDYAAQICNDLQITEGGKTYGDWYLPSKEELNLMYQNKTIIDATATANGGSAFFCPHGLWSSTEDTNNNAWRNGFNGAEYSTTKDFQAEIRAIRSF